MWERHSSVFRMFAGIFSSTKRQSEGLKNEANTEVPKTAVPQMSTWGQLHKQVMGERHSHCC